MEVMLQMEYGLETKAIRREIKVEPWTPATENQLECASVEATKLGMGIGSAPEGANLGTSAEAPESGNGHMGIKTLYIAL